MVSRLQSASACPPSHCTTRCSLGYLLFVWSQNHKHSRTRPIAYQMEDMKHEFEIPTSYDSHDPYYHDLSFSRASLLSLQHVSTLRAGCGHFHISASFSHSLHSIVDSCLTPVQDFCTDFFPCLLKLPTLHFLGEHSFTFIDVFPVFPCFVCWPTGRMSGKDNPKSNVVIPSVWIPISSRLVFGVQFFAIWVDLNLRLDLLFCFS